MPDSLITNPLGAGYFDLVQNGGSIMDIKIDLTVVGNSPIGTLVEIMPYAGPGAGAKTTAPTVIPAAIVSDNMVLGVIIGGQTVNKGSGTTIAPGSVAQVLIAGIAQVLVDQTTTVGSPLVQSTVVAGTARNGVGALGKVIGVSLQAVTFVATPLLCWSLIAKQ